MEQRDYIERLIQQIAAFVARIVGAARNGDSKDAEQALHDAWQALGLPWKDATRLDGATLKMLLGAKADLAASLLDAQAVVEESRSNATLADTLRSRATMLRG